jgi:RND family efflux transporter MFP subunit
MAGNDAVQTDMAMKKRAWIFASIAVAVLLAVVLAIFRLSPEGAIAQAPQAQQGGTRAIPIDIATVVQKPVPVQIDALGTVVPMASVAIKSRLETTIVGVHFEDGGQVREGDLLFTLDSRALEAQIRQAEGVVARDQAQLEGAERDLRRYAELVAKNASPMTNLDTAKTQAQTFAANLKANQAALDHLKVQLSYCTIRAAITGRISAALVKVGNFVRPSDTSPLATINQVTPIYVSFAVPQRFLPEVRRAVRGETAKVEAVVPGEKDRPAGRVTMIDNTVDPATGMVTIRATMDNEHEILWPGTLVSTLLTLRVEQVIAVPLAAVQVSQTGNYVFVVKDQTAAVRPVTVARTAANEAVISSGLAAGEIVVTDGQLLLSNGSRVAPRQQKTRAGA